MGQLVKISRERLLLMALLLEEATGCGKYAFSIDDSDFEETKVLLTRDEKKELKKMLEEVNVLLGR